MGNDFTKIAELQRRHGKVQGIMCYVNEQTLQLQHHKQEQNKARGIDGMTKSEYGRTARKLDRLNLQNETNVLQTAISQTYLYTKNR